MNGLLNRQNLSSPLSDSWTRTWKFNLYFFVVVFIFIWFYYSFYFIFFLDCSFIQWGLCVMVYLPFVIADDADHASVPPIALSCSYCTCFSQVLVLLDAGCHWWRSCHWLRVEQDKILSNTVTFWSSKTLLSQVFRHWGEKKNKLWYLWENCESI